MTLVLEAGFDRSLKTDLTGFDGFSNIAKLSRVATPFPVGTYACSVTGSSNQAYLQKTLASGVRQFAFRFYVNLAAWPASGVILRASASLDFQILVNSAGKIIPKIGSTAGATGSAVLTTSTGFRVEVTGDSSGTTYSLAYKVYDMAGTLLETSATMTLAGQTASDFTTVKVGQSSNTSTSFTFSCVKMTDSAADYPIGAGASLDPVEPTGLSIYAPSWVDTPRLIRGGALFGATAVMSPEVGACNIRGMQTAEGATKANRAIRITNSCFETTAPDDLSTERMLINGTALGHQCWPMVNLLGDSTTLAHDWPSGGIADFTNGLADALLDTWVTALNKLPATPVLCRLWREMNGTGGTFPWQNVAGSTYIAAWRYVYTYITTRCPQARFVWCCTARSGLADAAEFLSFDPGDAYVHWRAIDAYAFAGTYIDTLALNFYNAYNQVTGTNSRARPMMMTETQDNVSDPGRPAAYTAYGGLLSGLPLVRAVAFWDNLSTPFPINDTPAGSLAAFQGMALGSALSGVVPDGRHRNRRKRQPKVRLP